MSFEFQHNELHDYASYTYSASLFSISKDKMNELRDTDNLIADELHTMDLGTKVVYAETGGAAMSIDNIVISSAPNQNEQNFISNVSFDLRQPHGMSLPEKFVMAAQILGWGSFISNPKFLLEIRFSGIKSDGTENRNIRTITYPLNMINITTNFTPSGAIYNVHTSIDGSLNSKDTYAYITEQITLDDIKTSDDFFDKLEKRLNDSPNPDMSHGQTNLDTVSFEVDPMLRNLVFKKPDENTPINDVKLDYDENSGSTIHIPHNTSIPKLVETTLSVIPEVQTLLLDSAYVGYAIFCEPKLKYGDFDALLGRDTLNVTWVVRLREVAKVIDPNTMSADILNDLYERGQIVKKYSYYYSGDNTEVTDITLNLNYDVLAKATAYQNLFSNYANQQSYSSAKVEDKSDVFNQLKETSKINAKIFVAKPQSQDSNNQKIYLDAVTDINTEIIEQYTVPKYRKVSSDEIISSTSNINSSNKDEYMMSLENIRKSASMTVKELDMEIRGDTYWMLPFNSTIKYSNANNSLVRGVLFEVGYPIDVQDSDLTRKDQYFTGLYYCVGVTSNFNSGKFTQKLSLKRIYKLTVKQVE